MFALLLLAQEGAPAQPESSWIVSLMPLVLIVVVGYFLLFRPAQVQEKQRRSMVAALKRNDQIVNNGGIIGIVDTIKENKDEVVLKGGLRITKSSIVRVIAEDAAKE
jgi:preprotein translocase subunit YajC